MRGRTVRREVAASPHRDGVEAHVDLDELREREGDETEDDRRHHQQRRRGRERAEPRAERRRVLCGGLTAQRARQQPSLRHRLNAARRGAQERVDQPGARRHPRQRHPHAERRAEAAAAHRLGGDREGAELVVRVAGAGDDGRRSADRYRPDRPGEHEREGERHRPWHLLERVDVGAEERDRVEARRRPHRRRQQQQPVGRPRGGGGGGGGGGARDGGRGGGGGRAPPPASARTQPSGAPRRAAGSSRARGRAG